MSLELLGLVMMLEPTGDNRTIHLLVVNVVGRDSTQHVLLCQKEAVYGMKENRKKNCSPDAAIV